MRGISTALSWASSQLDGFPPEGARGPGAGAGARLAVKSLRSFGVCRAGDDSLVLIAKTGPGTA